MNAITFRSFARTAMELQSDSDTPPEYVMIKAAVAAKYGLQKESASEGWLRRMTASGARNATDSRLAKFQNNRLMAARTARAGEDTAHNNHVMSSNFHADSAAQNEVSYRSKFQRPQTKLAWNSGELAGLGILAAPSASNLAGHQWGEKAKDVSEVTGLGMLAAPYAHNIAAARSSRYANSGIGKRLAKAFSH
jgi:hypothetical protein